MALYKSTFTYLLTYVLLFWLFSAGTCRTLTLSLYTTKSTQPHQQVTVGQCKAPAWAHSSVDARMTNDKTERKHLHHMKGNTYNSTIKLIHRIGLSFRYRTQNG